MITYFNKVISFFVLHLSEADPVVFVFQLKAGAPVCAVTDARSAFFPFESSERTPPSCGLSKRIAHV
jgi:hypothetical protein